MYWKYILENQHLGLLNHADVLKHMQQQHAKSLAQLEAQDTGLQHHTDALNSQDAGLRDHQRHIRMVKELNEQSKVWLSAVAPFVNDDHNGMDFMKELARLSETAALDVADIWKATLENPFYVYDLEPLEQIFINLIAQGNDGKAAAKEIADVYIKNCDEAVVRLYQRIIEG